MRHPLSAPQVVLCALTWPNLNPREQLGDLISMPTLPRLLQGDMQYLGGYCFGIALAGLGQAGGRSSVVVRWDWEGHGVHHREKIDAREAKDGRDSAYSQRGCQGVQWSCMNGLAYTQGWSDYTAWSRVFPDTGATAEKLAKVGHKSAFLGGGS